MAKPTGTGKGKKVTPVVKKKTTPTPPTPSQLAKQRKKAGTSPTAPKAKTPAQKPVLTQTQKDQAARAAVLKKEADAKDAAAYQAALDTLPVSNRYRVATGKVPTKTSTRTR